MRSGPGRDSSLAFFCMALAVLLWGISFLSTKVVLRSFSPVAIAFLRQLIALVVLLPWAARSRALVRISRRDAGLFTLAGLFGIVLYFIFENSGLQYTTASNASLLVAALPVFTMASEALFFQLRITRTMVLCVAASVAGVYLLVTVDGRLDFGSSRLLGNALVLLAILCWVIYTIVNRRLAQTHSSLTAIAYQTLASAFLFLPLMGGKTLRLNSLAGIPAPAWVHLVFLGVFCSAVAYFCYVYALRRLGATLAASFLNLIPVVTVVGGFLFLGERLSWPQVGGMVLVLGAVFALSRATLAVQPSRLSSTPQTSPSLQCDT